ncbi:G-type lectin S-receptor-like serine/threonine-protein kinase At2g19130 [Quercus robur]|uniref:G-type lectin S-receptor-like serine/threonine-protein kinase At2g19130 n=1 Tax=Quercus robur TaxID=38942 RepID=UPI00216354BD|nr:G-type lectin S-receptor-like serine/threonine-protein kinase At2g19130 [Quercus robur]
MNSRISPLIAFLLLFFFLGFQSTNNTITDTILPGQSLTHLESIESPNGIFELCFFSPGNSTKYYLAIRFKNVSKLSVVWVANRKYPFPDSNPVPNINQDGDLVISNGTMTFAMTNTSAGNGTHAMLLDTSNLILTNKVLELFWQSFDYPTDTLLPGMTLEYSRPLTLWKSKKDPALDNFTLQLDYSLTIMEGPDVYWTGSLASFDVLSSNSWPTINYISQTQISRIVLDETGKLKLQSWLEEEKTWNTSLQSSRCGDYALCGAFSVCNETAQEPCGCLPGFTPVSAGAWSKGDVSSGCERKTALQCSNNSDVQKDGFLRMSKVDWLDNNTLRSKISSDKECQSSCLNKYDAPVGTNACKLVNQIGVQVRSNLSSYNVKNWKSVDAATRDVVLQSIAEKSRINSENRSKTSRKHRCGSKALAVRVDEEETILKVQEDHCQDPNAIPLTQEEISNLVFKKKSGIVKGLGMRPSSSLVTTASSSSVEYIHRLESEIIELKEARARDEEK